MTDSPRLDRRRLLGCAALYGAAAPTLLACSSDRADESTPAGAQGTSPSRQQDGGGAGQSAGALVAAAEVPVGGGVVLDDEKIVVVQPTEGDFRAYSAVCTHQGCLVGQVADGTINCPCHGSAFAVEDGDVVSGPASNPLPEVQVRVEDGQVSRA